MYSYWQKDKIALPSCLKHIVLDLALLMPAFYGHRNLYVALLETTDFKPVVGSERTW